MRTREDIVASSSSVRVDTAEQWVIAERLDGILEVQLDIRDLLITQNALLERAEVRAVEQDRKAEIAAKAMMGFTGIDFNSMFKPEDSGTAASMAATAGPDLKCVCGHLDRSEHVAGACIVPGCLCEKLKYAFTARLESLEGVNTDGTPGEQS